MNINLSRKQKVGIVVFLSILISLASIIYFTNKGNTEEDEIHTNRTLVENKINNSKNNSSDTTVNSIESIKTIKAYICGYVVNPGVYEVSPGDRVDDLVKRSGGFIKDADPKGVNLALEVKDQGYYRIPGINETVDIKLANDSISTVQGLASTGDDKSSDVKVNINTADKDSLKTLPRVGDAISQRIIDYREKEGKFKNIEDIKEVSGIGDKMFDAVKDKITVE